MTDLPKPETQLAITSSPYRWNTSSGKHQLTPTTFSTSLARQSINKRTQVRKNNEEELVKRLNARGMLLEQRMNDLQRRNQDNYKLLIQLSTNVTGKHTIFYSTRMTQQDSFNVGPPTQTSKSDKKN